MTKLHVAQPQTKQGGSALRRLKLGLKEAGLIGNPRTKRGAGGKRANLKAAVAAAVRIASRESLVKDQALQTLRQTNPFESHFNRTKHEVLGRTVVGSKGRPGLTRQQGLEKRKEGLLSDLRATKRTSSFVDLRIGEKGSKMSRQDIMALRWTKEKLHISSRMAKRSMYNLDKDLDKNHDHDDDRAETSPEASSESYRKDLFTHHGRPLVELNDSMNIEQDGFRENSFQSAIRINLDTEDIDAETNARLRNALTESSRKSRAEVMQEIIASSKKKKAERQKQQAQNEDLRVEMDTQMRSLQSLLQKKRDVNGFDDDNESADEYERTVERLKYDRRALATDRLKTEEELAAEECEKLEKLEMSRLRRMNQEADSGSEMLESDTSDSDIQEEEEEDKEYDADYDDESKLDNEEDELEKSIPSNMQKQNIVSDTLETSAYTPLINPIRVGEESATELPYKFDIPKTQVLFDLLMLDRNGADVATLFSRLRVLYHPALGEGNRERVGQCFVFFLNYLWRRWNPNVNEYMTEVYPHIRELAPVYTVEFAEWCSTKLSFCMQSSTIQIFTGFQLALLRAVANIFSSSDFHHAVITPLQLCLATFISQPKRSLVEICATLHVASQLLDMQKLCKRWIPEVFNTLISILSAATGDFSTCTSPEWLHYSFSGLKLEVEPASPTLPTAPEQCLKLASPWKSIILCTIKIVIEITELYGDGEFKSFSQTFQPIAVKLKAIKISIVNDSEIEKACSAGISLLESKVKYALENKKPVQLQNHRPIAIKELEPSFEKRYDLDRKSSNLSADNGDREVAKLKALVKKEKRSAIRELRRDAQFLAGVKLEERRKSDNQYNEKIRKIMGNISNEVGETKKDGFKASKRVRTK